MLSEITSGSKEEWLKDLQQIKDPGYNTVRIWVEWQRAEPRPGRVQFWESEITAGTGRPAG